jgi:hypothetical protein
MKYFILAALLFFSLSINAQTTYPSGVTGCIARWNFANSGTVTSLPDVSGNGHNGTTTSVTSAAAFRNIANGAMQFNGTSSNAIITNTSLLTPSSISIVAVVNMDTFYSGSCQLSQFICKGQPHNIAGGYGLGLGDNTFDASCSIYSPNNMQLNAQMGGFTHSIPTPGNYVQLRKWYFTAVAYSGTNIQYYQVEMDTNVYNNSISPIYNITGTGSLASGTAGTGTQDISIGYHLNTSFPYWATCKMDEIVLFNKQTTTAEIQSVYDYLWGLIRFSFNNRNMCSNDTFHVSYTPVNTTLYNTGNVFSVELSNATGSFASPTVIGSVTSTTAGTIICTIPTGVASGAGYRIRVTSSNVRSKMPDNGTNLSINLRPLNFSATSNSPLCVGDTLRLFGNTTSSNVNFSWTGPNSFSSTAQNPVLANVSSVNAGNYILTATLVGGCASAIDTETVTITAIPATPAASSNSPVCAGSSINLSAVSSTSGVNYIWTGPASFSSTSQTPSRSPAVVAHTGTYAVRASLNGCLSAPGTTNVIVNPQPAAPNAGSNSPICTGAALSLTASTISGATYSWTGPTGFTSTMQNSTRPGITGADAGTYSVVAIVNGCASNSASTTVTTIAGPTVNIYPSPKDSICEGGTVRFTALPVGAGTAPTYQWYRNNTPITGATGTAYNAGTAVSNGDQFYCIMTDNQVCGGTHQDTSIVITMRVLPYIAPSASISMTPTGTFPSGTMINFTATASNAGIKPGYQWIRNSKNVIGAISNVWGANNLQDKDTICVEVTSTYLCPEPQKVISDCIVVNIIPPAGIDNNKLLDNLSLSPNPNNGSFTLTGNTNTNEPIEIAVHNAIGQVLFTKQVLPVNGGIKANITLPEVASGIYLLRIHTEDGSKAIRFRVDK